MKFIVSAIAASIIPFMAIPAVAQYMPERNCLERRGVYTKGWCITETDNAVYAFTWTEDSLVFGYGISDTSEGEHHAVLVNDEYGNTILQAGKFYHLTNYYFSEGNMSILQRFTREGLYAEALITGYIANE